MTDRPIITAIEEREREEATRRRHTAERCELMERAMREIGFAPGTVYWCVAMLVARVSSGWQPFVRTLDQLAEDPDCGSSASDARGRKRSITRALAELQREGLLVYSTQDGEARRRTRCERIVTITLCRDAIIAAAEGNPMPRPAETEREKISSDDDRDADNGVDRPWTTVRTAEWTDRGQQGGQRQSHLLIPLSPKNPGPLSPLGSEDEDQKKIKSNSLVETTIEATTPTMRRLCRAIRIGPNAGDLETLWRAAAAFDAGLITEHAIADAARAALTCAGRSPVGYFRTTLAERASVDAEGLKRILGRVVCQGGWPKVPPPRGEPAPQIQTRSVPAEQPVSMHDRQREILETLARIG